MLKRILIEILRKLYFKFISPFVQMDIIAFEQKPRIKGNNNNLKIADSVIIRENVELECYNGRIEIGDNSIILQDVKILCYGGNIKIGENVSVNPYCILYGHGNLTIGDNVRIANSSIFIPSNHNTKSIHIPIWKQGETSKGIVINDDVWIGSNVKVLDNVCIAKGIVVGAGSVVTKSLTEEYGVYAGVPAKFIKYRYE